jgi:DNA-binding CsgD family transcriptional regulator
LGFALDFLARAHILAGELTAAARLIEEDRLIAEATGNPPIAYTAMTLAAWRGQETHACELIEATVQEATARGLGRPLNFAAYATSVLYNGLGRHDAARDAAWPAFERDQLGYGPFIVPELAEAASRTGDVALVRAALQWLSERTQMTPTEWALGIQARIRALLSDGEDAERFYRESIARLGRTRVRAELARAHLLYGEWLRRERRRADAREQLRTAHAMLDTMGIGAFAERARRELLATGETARKRTVETSGQLTAQEAQVARLARDGLSNPQISARLFISPRTVRYHLTKVFTKLGITRAASSTASCPATRTPPRRVSPAPPGAVPGRSRLATKPAHCPIRARPARHDNRRDAATAGARAPRSSRERSHDASRRHDRHSRRKRAVLRADGRQALPGWQAPRGLAGASGRPDRERLAGRQRRAITGAVRGIRPRAAHPRRPASRERNTAAGVLPRVPADPDLNKPRPSMPPAFRPP